MRLEKVNGGILCSFLLCISFLLSSSSCQQTENSFSGDAERFGRVEDSDDDSVLFKSVRTILAKRCGSCHPTYPSYTEAQWKLDSYHVIAGDPNCSRLFYRLSGSGAVCSALSGEAQNMPSGSFLQSTDIDTIRQWIDSLDDVPTDPSAPPQSTQETRRAAALAVITANCLSCHNTTQTSVYFGGATVPSFALYTSDNDFVNNGMILPGNPAASWLYRALKDYGDIDSMPQGASALSATEEEKVRVWIEKLLDP